jgi:hypothetical protein
LKSKVETTDTDILEAEEIRYNNLVYSCSENAFKSKTSLLYSREIPFRSMEIYGVPVAKSKVTNSHQWIRVSIYKKQDSLWITLHSSKDSNTLFDVTLDRQSYFDI